MPESALAADLGLRLLLALTVGGIRALAEVVGGGVRVDGLVHRAVRARISDCGIGFADLARLLLRAHRLALGHVRAAFHVCTSCSRAYAQAVPPPGDLLPMDILRGTIRAGELAFRYGDRVAADELSALVQRQDDGLSAA